MNWRKLEKIMSYGPKKLRAAEIAEERDVTEEQAMEVIDYLVSNGWMLGRYVEFNVRESSNLDLPGE